MADPRRLVLLAMYPLDRIDKGSTVRIYNVHRALAACTPVDLLCGNRRDRGKVIRAYLSNGNLENAFGLYVETCTSWCTLDDIRLMLAGRRAGLPVFTWIPDAYPLFPETSAGLALQKRLGSSLLWRLSMWSYFRISDAIGSQSESFSRLFRYPRHVRRVVLEPGANELDVAPISAEANTLLYTGNASEGRFGVDLLVRAAEAARSRLPNLHVLLVCPPSGLPPAELYASRSWVELMSLTTDEIVHLLPQVRVLVNPLRDAPYHRLQIPTKVMDYLGYGRPILATDLPEIARVIRQNEVGIVVPDTVPGMADGILQLFDANLDEVNRLGQNALQAVRQKHSWRHRAQQILDLFEEMHNGRR